MKVDSEEGVGTDFQIELPLGKIDVVKKAQNKYAN